MTSIELAPSSGRWSGGGLVVVDQAGAVDRLPGTVDVDPYWRLSTAFLLGYRENSRKAYRHDLEAWWSWCGRFEVHPFDAQRHHVNAWIRSMELSTSTSAPLASSTIPPSALGGEQVLQVRDLGRSPNPLPRQPGRTTQG